jgi:hypothetical protein
MGLLALDYLEETSLHHITFSRIWLEKINKLNL